VEPKDERALRIQESAELIATSKRLIEELKALIETSRLLIAEHEAHRRTHRLEADKRKK